jgi:outer membrane receptor protein involved in Fe transport
MKKFHLILPGFLFIAYISSQAQRPGGGMDQGSKPDPIGVIKGKVLDKKTNQPLSYSNLILHSQRDSSMVTGAISTEDGSFIIEKVPFGRFYLEVKFIGYQKHIIKDLRINPQSVVIDLGTITLDQGSQQLEEVTVTAERTPVEFKIDKKIVNISENLNSMGSSVARALENAPSITVDIDGTVALRGSTNYTVLIDGKPSPLKGSDALQQIPASAVENVEIITNPSAKYDPDGLAGIINIITKKRALDGISGITNISVGTRDKYRGDAMITFKSDKLTIYAGGDFNNEHNYGNQTRTTMTESSDTARYIESNGSSDRNRYGYTVRSGITYNFKKIGSFTLEGSGGNHSFNNTENGYYHQYTVPASTDVYYLNNNIGARPEDFYGITFNYDKTFGGLPNHKITSYFYYEKEMGKSNNTLDQIFTDNNWNEIATDPNNIKTNQNTNESGLRFQVDYTRPLGQQGKLETGYQARVDRSYEDYNFYNYDHLTDTWVNNPIFTNAMNYRNDIHSAYGTYSNEFKTFGIQIGLRAEYSSRSIQNQKATAPSTLDLFDFFPSLHLSKKIGKQDQLLASYSRRINRPRGFFLDPFPQYIDPNTIRKGNPNLLPEYIDSYELTYQKGLGKSFISLEGYYRLTHNAMSRVTEVMPDGTRVFTMENLNKQHAGGAELMFNIQLNRWFNFNASTNVYLFKIEGTVSDNSVAVKSTNSDFRLNANFKLTSSTRLQVQGFYQGPSVTAQGTRKEFFMSSASVKQDFLKQKLSATLQFRDIFKTGNFSFVNEGANFHDEFTFQREGQVLMLTLTYKINNFKNKEKGRGENEGGGNEDVIMNNQ